MSKQTTSNFNLINSDNNNSRTPLLWAIRSNPEIVKLLLTSGASRTPLFAAIEGNNLEIVKLLLAKPTNLLDIPEVNRPIIYDAVRYKAKNNSSSKEELFESNKLVLSLIELFNCYNKDGSINFTKLLDIFIENINDYDLRIISSIKEVDELLKTDKFDHLLDKIKKSFTEEFREFYNLPKLIKLNDKFKIDLLEKLQDKYLTLFSNYNLLKDYIISSEKETMLKELEKFLLFNEKEESDFNDELLRQENFINEKIQAAMGSSKSQNSYINKGSLDEPEEKENSNDFITKPKPSSSSMSNSTVTPAIAPSSSNSDETDNNSETYPLTGLDSD